MTLRDMLKETDLLQYIEKYCSTLNKIKINTYEKIENGFKFSNGKNQYRVIIQKSVYDNEYTYVGEKLINYGMFESYEKIPCITRTDEKKYPKSVAWLGTALVEKYNNNL